MRHQSLTLACLMPLLASCGPKPGSRPAPTAPVPAGPARLVDIGGRKLQMLMLGQGSPTVVIESGMGEPGAESGTWRAVAEEISRSNRVCLYDRAGLGKSDPAPKLPRTCVDMANDLHALLTKADVTGPLLLVGHSYGGLHIRVFASEHSDRVVGMVLVDSTHPDQDEQWLSALPSPTPDEPESVRNARQFLASRTTPASNPEQIDPRASAAQVRAAHGLGNKPLVVLSHSTNFSVDPQLPAAVSRNIEDVSQRLQTELLRLSTRSALRQSANGGHNLHVEDHELVVQGIRQALAAATEKPPPPRSAPRAGPPRRPGGSHGRVASGMR